MHLYKMRRGRINAFALSLLAFALLSALALYLLDDVDRRAEAEQTALLRNALRRAAVTCYAVEGRYPSGLDELTEQYGVQIDETKYIVRYDAFASNLMPDIVVLRRGGVLN